MIYRIWCGIWGKYVVYGIEDMVCRHEDPRNHGFRTPPCHGPWNQDVGSFSVCAPCGPDA